MTIEKHNICDVCNGYAWHCTCGFNPNTDCLGCETTMGKPGFCPECQSNGTEEEYQKEMDKQMREMEASIPF